MKCSAYEYTSIPNTILVLGLHGPAYRITNLPLKKPITCEYVRGLIASGNTPSVLFTHVTTVGPAKFSVPGCDCTMSIRSVALPLQNEICERRAGRWVGRSVLTLTRYFNTYQYFQVHILDS